MWNKLIPYRHSGGKTNTINIPKVDDVEESDMEDNAQWQKQ